MILDKKTWEHLKNALRDYITANINSKWHPPYDFHRFLLDEDVVRVLRELPTHIDKILEKVPKTYRSKVRRALELLSRNIDKTVSFISNPPPWFRDILLISMLNEFGVPVYPRALIEEHAEELAKVIPFKGDIEYGGNTFSAVVLYLDDKEIKSIRFNAVDVYSDLISSLSLNASSPDPNKQSVKLYEYEIFFPRPTYYKVLNRLYRDDIVKNMIEEDLRDIMPELSAFGSVVHSSPTTIIINLSKAMVNTIVKATGLDIRDAKVVVSLKPSERSGSVRLDADVWTPVDYHKFVVAYGFPAICVSGKCKDVPAREIEFSDYNEIPKAVRTVIERTIEVLTFTKMHLDRFTEAANRYGFKVKKVDAEYSGYVNVAAEKEFKLASAEVSMKIDYNTGKVEEYIEASLPLERTPKTDVPIAALVRIGERLDDYRIESYKGWKIRRKTSYTPDEIDEAFRKAIELASSLEATYEEFVQEKERKKAMKIPTEHYVAVYLTNQLRTWIHDTKIDVEKTLGRPMLSVYGAVRSIVNKYAPDAEKYVGSHPLEVAYSLFTSKYITVDPELRLYINGQRYADIVVKYGLSPTEAEAREKALAVTLVMQHIYRNAPKPAVVTLNEIGLLSDAVIAAILSNDQYTFDPEEMAMEIDGKPVWHRLSVPTKALYMMKTPIYRLAAILFDRRLREVFSDVVNGVKEAVLESGNASLITRYIVENMPDAVGIPKDAKIVSEGSLYAVDVGPFLVQVRKFRGDNNEFIVYDKNTKVGFLFKGRTIMDAVKDAVERYNRMYRVLNELHDMATSGELYRWYNAKLTQGGYGEYKFYYLEVWRAGQYAVIHIDEHTKEKLERIRNGELVYDEIEVMYR